MYSVELSIRAQEFLDKLDKEVMVKSIGM